jgi:hypothetical protein
MNKPKKPEITELIDNKEIIERFMENMTIITKQTWVEFQIDTKHEWIARMIPGVNKVFFNPEYAIKLYQMIAEQRLKETWIKSDFHFDINHLSALVLHKINHIINHDQLKKSTQKIKYDNKTFSMEEFHKHITQKYGMEFHEFENQLEDIDVNFHATKIQAPVYDNSRREIYQNIAIPSGNFSKIPLHEQFARTCLRWAMLEDETCKVDSIVQNCLNFVNAPWGLLDKIKDPNLTYDEQFPAIVELYEEYYLKLKKMSDQQQDSNPQKKQDPDPKQQNSNKTGQDPSQEQQTPDQQEQDSNQEWQNSSEQQQDPSQKQQTPDQQEQDSNQEWQNSSEQQQDPSQKQQTPDQQEQDSNQEWQNSSEQQQDPSQKQQTPDQQEQNSNQQEQNSKEQGSDQQQDSIKDNPDIQPMTLPSIFDNPEKFKPQNSQEKNQESTNEQLEEILKQDSSKEAEKWKDENQQEKQQQNNEQLQQMIEDMIEKYEKEKNKSPEERNLEEKIKKERDLWDDVDQSTLDTYKEKIKKEEQYKEKLKSMKDKEGRPIYDYLTKEIFAKIVQQRKKRSLKEKSPQPLSEWGQFDPHSFVSGIVEIKSGSHDPIMMKQEFRKEKTKKLAGGFNLTIITDWSSSMRQKNKNQHQKDATMLMIYALQQLNEELKNENLSEPLKINTQVMMFNGSDVDILKKRNTEMTIKDVIKIWEGLDYDDWPSTNADEALELYEQQLSQPFDGQTKQQHEAFLENIKNDKDKEIVFLLSDWEFNSSNNAKPNAIATIKRLREKNVIVCGIWITKDWAPMVPIFGKKSSDPQENKNWFGIVCKDSQDLWRCLEELLLEHLDVKWITR